MSNNRIGVLLADNLGCGLTHEFFSRVLEPFKEFSEGEGFVLSFLNAQPKYLINHTFMDQIADGGYAGVFIVNIDYEMPEVRAIFKSGIPCVTIDYKTEGAVSVVSDNEHGIIELVNYICVEKKHKKIAYISGDPDSEVSRIRLRAFNDACDTCGIKVPPEYIKESRFRDIRDVTRKTEELLNLPVPPTCIFFPDDYAAIGGINVIRNRGLEVPKDVSYCGYDGVNLVSLWDPQLATVVQDTDTMGVTAARELIRMIDEGSKPDGSEVIIPTRLQIGHTVSQMY